MLRLLCILLLVANATAAQHKKFPWPKRPKSRPAPVVIPPKPGLVINTNLLSLHEPEGGPSLGLEYRISLHFSVMVEGTALLYTLEKKEENGRGFRVQPEVRYWFAGRHRTFRGFFSLQATYKQTNFPDSAYIKVSTGTRPSDVRYDPVYYESKKQVLAGAANIGFQARFGRNERFMVETYAGMGLKSKDYYGEPPGTAIPPLMDDKLTIIPNYNKPGTYPHLAMGVRVGYCF